MIVDARHFRAFSSLSNAVRTQNEVLAFGNSGFRAYMRRSCRMAAACFFAVALAGCAGLNMTKDDTPENRLPPQAFHFNDGETAVYYSLDVGAPAPDGPLVFFVSGSGCATIRHRLVGFFAPLQSYPVHVLALQKRGIEPDSSGNECTDHFIENDYFERIVSDQRAFIDRQLAERAVPPRAVVLIGASEGSVVAAKIASSDNRITHLALIGSGGSTMKENLRMLAKSSWLYSNVDDKFKAISQDPGSFRKTVFGHSYRYWSSMLDIDLDKLLLPLRIPILVGMGEKDESVPSEMALILKRHFEEAGKDNLIVRIYPNADHRLQDHVHSKAYSVDFLHELGTLVYSSAARK